MTTLESTRLRPAQSTPTSTPLSILDATVARFAPTGAIWILDQPVEVDRKILIDNLRISFIETLARFPQWAGQLQWAPFNPKGKHTERFNRPFIVYGTNDDPGVEWTVIEHPIAVDEIIPTAEDRASSTAGSRHGAWAGNSFDQNLFISSNPLALANLRDYVGLPGMQVQITLLRDGAYVVGIKMAHCLADAQSLMVFVHLWAFNSQKKFGHSPAPPKLGEPVFDPESLDKCAAGDIDSTEPDQNIIQTARLLPLHRYSWWDTAAQGYPQVCIPTSENSKPEPAELDHERISPSEPAPWTSWDFDRPVSYTQLHFTGAELRELRSRALESPESRRDLSRLDALLEHLWIIITRARGYTDSSREVYLNLSLGARGRVSPALPDTFIGSPLFLTHVGGPASWACKQSPGETASRIRETMKGFTADAVGAMLHDAAYEISPQRLWQGFLGSEHTLVTSWLRLQLYEVDFVGGTRPRYVHAVMPKMDGCIQVMDSAVGDGGMDVALYLDREATHRLLGESCRA